LKLYNILSYNSTELFCGWVIEDAIHFFLECCLYVEVREQLTNNPQFLDSLLIETLLFGDDSLSEGAFKLLDLCLSLVCRTFNTLQPYK
jgi:hypothetical protein